VSESTINVAAGIVPKRTAVVPVKPLPVIVTAVPPEEEPTDGLRFVIFGWTAPQILTDKNKQEIKKLKKGCFTETPKKSIRHNKKKNLQP
jgi:hypothetical protein